MPQRERDFRLALLGISGLSGLGYLVRTASPDAWWLIVLFFLLVSVTVYGWMQFVFVSSRLSLTTTLYVCVCLILRLFHLRHPLYAILLLLFMVSLEVMRRKR